jgi:glycosyltransferase involved in cell wall biosynthesis
MDQKPMVSVVMITYNHEKYIAEAMNGVFMQKCDFDIEFIIANDKSTDETDRKILECLSEVSIPKNIKIEYANHEQNKGVSGNFIWALQQARGKYIAYCEGDDYWTAPSKLQKQIDFLEGNPEYEMCFTNTQVVNNLGLIKKDKLINNVSKTTYLNKDMPIWAPALTRVFKNRDFNILDKSVPGMDTFMMVYQSTLGKIRYIDEITGSYRVHYGGVFSMISQAKKYEHKIKTTLACLQFVEVKFKKKHIGQILKDLVELRIVDDKLFKSTIIRISEQFEEIRKAPKTKYYLFLMYFFLIQLPYLYKLPFFNKTINKMIIY